MSQRVKWDLSVLGRLCDKIGSGVTPRGGESVYIDEGVSLIRSQNVYNAEFSTPGLAHINQEIAKKMKGVTVEQEDVLLNITGDSVARCCIVPNNVLPARVNQHVSIVRVNPDYLDARFLMYYLVSPYMQAYMLSLAGSGGTRKALTKSMIEDFRIPLPSIVQQLKITSILSTYDDLIENNRRRIALLEEAARLLYREWFVYLRFPGHEHTPIVDGVPQGWERDKLGTVLTLQRGFDLPKKQRQPGNVPIYASTGINGYHNMAKVNGPGVVTGRSGSLGTVLYVPYDFWPLNTALWVKEFKRVTPVFAQHLLSVLRLERFDGGTAVPTLNRNDVHRISILIPSVELIDRFTDIALPIYTQISKLELYNKRLVSARDLLLPRLMNGEIAV